MKNARLRVSVSSNADSEHDLSKREDSQEMEDLSPTTNSPLSTERRSRYSMNYQSYEATRIQPGEQTRRMLDYMFPGYQKRDPRNWYEMQTQTDLGFSDVTSLIGTELIEGEPIEAYDDRKKSLGESFGDDYSDYEGSPTSMRATAKKGHRSSIATRAWEGPPIKLSGKASEEGFHLEVDDYYHEPQTILVPKEVIEHQELKMDIVPDEQGIPKVVIYLGKKDPSVENAKEEPDSTVILFDGKEEFDASSTASEEEEVKSPTPVEEVPSDMTEEGQTSELDIPAARDSLTVVPPTVGKVEMAEPETSVTKSEEESAEDNLQGQKLNNSVFLEPIKATGSHVDVFEDVIDDSPKEVLTPPKEPTPPPEEPTPPPEEQTPPPEEPTPPPEEPTPPPKEVTPVPKEPTPPPREPTPPPREPTPPPREPTPPPKEPTPPPREPTPPLEEPDKSISVVTVPSTPSLPSPKEPSVARVAPPSPPPSPEPVATISMPSQTSSHIGSPPDHLFGPLENYPNDLEEESDKVVHSPPQQPSPSKDGEDDHPLRLTDDYPPQYSPPPSESSDISNWLEDNILSEAKKMAARSPQHKSPQKSPVAEPKVLVPESESQLVKPKPKVARFGDDENVPDECKRPLEERFSIYYPPSQPKKKRVADEEIDSDVKEAGDKAEEEAVSDWLEGEILNPAAVDDWVDQKILSKAKKSPDGKGSPHVPSFPTPVDDDSEKVDAWMEDEILKPAQVDKWVDEQIIKPGSKLSGQKRKSETPQPRASQPSLSSGSLKSSPSATSVPDTTLSPPKETTESEGPEMAPQMVLPKDRSVSSDRSVDGNEEEVDSWVTNELVQPAQADVWLEKEVVQPAQGEKWVDHQLMKPASVQHYVDKHIIKPANVQSYVDEKIMKPASVLSYVDEKIVKPASAQRPVDGKIKKPSAVESYVDSQPSHHPSPVTSTSPATTSDTSPDKYAINFPEESFTTVVELPQKETPPKVIKESPIEEKSVEIPKPFQVPETYVSDTNLMGPFQPHPDHPDEYPKNLSLVPPAEPRLVVPTAPSKPEPIEEQKPEIIASTVSAAYKPETSSAIISVEEESEPSASKMLEHPTVEKTPTEQVGVSLTSLGRKPSLKQKSDSGSISKTRVDTMEPEKRDRPSILAKKAMENNNYLLRDDDIDYIVPKIPSGTNLPDKRTSRRSSSVSKKICPLTNLFKKKRSSKEEPGPSLFTQPSFRKRGSSGNEDSRKDSRSPLSSIDEEELDPHRAAVPPSKPETSGIKPDTDPSRKIPVFKSRIDQATDSEKKSGDGEQRTSKKSSPGSDPGRKSGYTEQQKPTESRSDAMDFSSITVVTTTKSIDFPVDSSLVPHETTSPPSQTALPPPFQVDISPSPPPATVPTPTQDIAPSSPGSDIPKDERPANQSKPRLVAPEELDLNFPKFPDHKEAMANREKPADEKPEPDPPKRGFPMFPDYKQLTEAQSEPLDLSPSMEEHGDSYAKPHVSAARKGAPVDETHASKGTPEAVESIVTSESKATSKAKETKIPSAPSELEASSKMKELKSASVPSTNYPSLGTPKFQREDEADDVQQLYPQKNLEHYMQDTGVPQTTKSDVKAATSCTAEPMRPGNGVPEFPDYNEITQGSSNQPKQQNDMETWLHQKPTSLPKSPFPPQQTMGQQQGYTFQPLPAPKSEKEIPSPYSMSQQLKPEPFRPSASQPQEIPYTGNIPHTVPQHPQTFPGGQLQESARSLGPGRPLQEPASSQLEYSKPYEQESHTSSTKFPKPLGGLSQHQSPFKKHDYAQPDRPLQLVSTPDSFSKDSPLNQPQSSTFPQPPAAHSAEKSPRTYTMSQPLQPGPHAPQSQEIKPPYGREPQESAMPYSTGQPLHTQQQLQQLSSPQLEYFEPHEQESRTIPAGLTKLPESHSKLSQLQAPSFKKHDYSQPDRPLQRMSTPSSTVHSQPQGPRPDVAHLQPQLPLQRMSTPSSTVPSQPQGPRPDVAHLQPQFSTQNQYPSQMSPSQLQDLRMSDPRAQQQNRMLDLPESAVPQAQQRYSPNTPYSASESPVTPSLYGPAHLQQQSGAKRPDHSDPRHQHISSQDRYISIKQRPTPQSPTSLVSPYGQPQQQGPYSSTPQRPTQQPPASASSPYRPVQQQGPHDPSSRVPQNGTQQSSGLFYSPQGPVQHQTPYTGVSSSPYSKPPQSIAQQPPGSFYIPQGPVQHQTPFAGELSSPYSKPPQSTTQQPSAQIFSPYRPVPQKLPSHATVSQRPKSPVLEKHTYSNPEKPLPLSPVRPSGLEDEHQSQHSSLQGKIFKPDSDALNRARQMTPVDPGGGVPRFPDFPSEPTAKPPTMKGDFSTATPRPKTVTAADKRAEFDKEIYPIIKQIQDLKRQMYELTPQKGPPMRTGPGYVRPIPTSLQLYNELEKRTLDGTKSEREQAHAERRKQQYEANARRKIQRAIESA